MRNSLFQATTLLSFVSWLSLVLAATHDQIADQWPDITSVPSVADHDSTSIEFSVPCSDCSLDAEKHEIILNLQVDGTTTECVASTIRINGVPLSQPGYGDPSTGFLELSASSNTDYRNTLLGVWQLWCIDGEASLLSVILNAANSSVSPMSQAGFAVSFRQLSSPVSQPSFIRLQTYPETESLKNLNHDYAFQPGWLNPPEARRLSVSYPSLPVDQHSIQSLEQKLEELQSLQVEANRLLQQRRDLEEQILNLMKAEYNACTSWMCMINTAVKSAPSYAELIRAHFRHHSLHRRHVAEQVLQLSPAEGIDAEDAHEQPSSAASGKEAGETGSAQDSNENPNQDSSTEEHEIGQLSTESVVAEAQSTSTCNDLRPGLAKGRFGLLTYGGLDPGQRSKQFYLFMAVLGLSIAALTCAAIFAAGLYLWTYIRDPRRRAERAARREERETRRLYRKAARRYQWSRWWKRCKRSVPTGDYEEKRAMIIQRGGLHEDVIQRQMNNLRAAHDLVADLVRAEEGRAQPQQGVPPHPSRPMPNRSISDSGEGSSRRTDSLPPYSPPPPQYETELTEELSIVDSFEGYLPSNIDDTPDSSVVDCSPRLSFETQRTTFTRRSEI